MEITILGSGTPEPEVDRHGAALLAKVNGQNIVFDFGRGALEQLMKCGVGYHEIDAIFITHAHADHCADLVSFLWIALSESERSKRKKEVTIFGPEGFGKTIEGVMHAFFMEKNKPKHKILVKELSGGTEAKGDGWAVKCYRSEHFPDMESLIYRLESGEKSFVYTGDTADCDGLREALRGADLAVVEASSPKSAPSQGHLNGEDAGKIALVSNVRKLVLTHIFPHYMKSFSPKAEARRYFKGKLSVAKDLMKISV